MIKYIKWIREDNKVFLCVTHFTTEQNRKDTLARWRNINKGHTFTEIPERCAKKIFKRSRFDIDNYPWPL